jgi:hypothetical protein
LEEISMQCQNAAKSQNVKKAIVIAVIVTMAGFLGVVAIGCSTLPLIGPIARQRHDQQCKNNLKAFDVALALYKNDYNGKYPSYSGVKFLAVLYRCGYLTEKKYFLCPAKESDKWIEDGSDKTAFKFAKPAHGENYSENWDPKFTPTEFSYAGRRNDPADDNGAFVLPDKPTDPTPVASDNTLGRGGEHNAKYAPHGSKGGEVNVLLTNGSIIPLRNVTVGVSDPNAVPMDLECLMDDNDNKH